MLHEHTKHCVVYGALMKGMHMIRPIYHRKKNHDRFYQHELGVVLFGALILFCSAALSTYNPSDPTWFYASSNPESTKNVCGTVGAHGAAFARYLFGWSSWIMMMFVFFIWFLYAVRRPLRTEIDRISAFVLAIGMSAAWSYVYQIDGVGVRFPGGLVGMKIYTALHGWLDDVGALLCIYTLLVISFIIITRLSFVSLMQYIFTIARPLFTWRVAYACARGFQLSVARCMQVGSVVGVHLKSFVTGAIRVPDEPTYIHEEYDVDATEQTIYNDNFWQTIASPAMLQHEAHSMPVMKPMLPDFDEQDIQAKIRASYFEKSLALRIPLPHDTSVPEKQEKAAPYTLPSLDIFIGVPNEKNDARLMRELEDQAHVLQEKLARFGIAGSVVSIKRGPVVTLFEYQPDIDSKLSKIVALEDDLALALQALSIRIIAPIPGKSVVGFEVANKKCKNVVLASVIQSADYRNFSGTLPLVLGEDTIGNNVVVDLATMPHLLIAGSTGSGKSVALNAMLVSLLCKCTPDELHLILIDPKRLEFAPYADIAHLIFPIVTDPRKAAQVLTWVVKEMEGRYTCMAASGARSIVDYNKTVGDDEKLPYIVVIIDELSDLMMTSGREVEDLIARIAQMARAAGIHLIIATQRPSVDVITGLIKANFPSRISFRVASKIDARTILDCTGADKLLGRGDMLFLDSRASMLKRVHGAYVSDKEIEELVAYIRAQRCVTYRDLAQELPNKSDSPELEDVLYADVVKFLAEIEEVSISLLQRKFRIGYNRSARLIDILENQGLIMPSEGGKTRKVIK